MRVNCYELKHQLANFCSVHNASVFDIDKFYPFDVAFPLFWYSRHTLKCDIRINIDKLKGNKWVFKSKVSRVGYPLNTNKKTTLMPVFKVMGSYFVEEVNRRLYVSKLLNRKSILADILEYDYEYMLNQAVLHNDSDRDLYYVSYNQQTYELNHEEATNFQKLQNLIVW